MVMITFSEYLYQAFFWSDLNFGDDETCYLDMCEQHNPCDENSKCVSTWDGQKAGVKCESDSVDDSENECE